MLDGFLTAACKTVEYYQEIIGIELFRDTLNAEEKFWAMERKPIACVRSWRASRLIWSWFCAVLELQENGTHYRIVPTSRNDG